VRKEKKERRSKKWKLKSKWKNKSKWAGKKEKKGYVRSTYRRLTTVGKKIFFFWGGVNGWVKYSILHFPFVTPVPSFSFCCKGMDVC
jgi:hypothetical protein